MHIYETLVKKDSVVVEIGSHIGSLTVPISRLCKTLFTFEPQRLLFQLLNTNLVINNIDNVVAYLEFGMPCGSSELPGSWHIFPD